MHIYLHSNPLNGVTASNELGDYYKIYKSAQMFSMQKHFVRKKINKDVQNLKEKSLFEGLTSQTRCKKDLVGQIQYKI